MPGPPLCAKCRQTSANEGDSWCTGCTAWEFVGRELTAAWGSTSARALASDIVLSAGRQIRALRSLSAGLARVEARPRAGDPPREGSERATLPRRRSQAPPPPVPKEEEVSCEEEETEEESGQRDPTPEAVPIRGSSRRPPEPDGPPPGKRHHPPDAGRSRASRGGHSGSHREHRERSGRREHTRGKRRGGRKHQRLYRLATDPTKVIHRKPGHAFWELRSSDLGQLELDRLGR